MKKLVIAIALVVATAFNHFAQAAEVKVLSSVGFQTVMGDLRPKFESATGHTLVMTFDTGGGLVKRIQGGETFDVIVTARPGMDGFVKDGKVIANTVIVIARSCIGVAVRKGSPNPISRRPRCSSVRFSLQSPSPIRIPLAAARAVSTLPRCSIV